MKLTFKRIKQLERGELFARINRKIWAAKTKHYVKHTPLRIEKNKRATEIITDSQSNNPFPHNCSFYFADNEYDKIRSIYNRYFSEKRDNLLAEAEKYCSNQFKIFGHPFYFKEKINWHLDPISGKEWPQTHFLKISYTGSNKLGDIKYSWELNRCQHLVTLGQAYCITQNEKFAHTIVSQIYSWIDTNPPFIGIHWVSSLEIAIRLINWLWAIHLIKKSDKVNTQFYQHISDSLGVQAEHLYHNLSIGYYANNHLIGEAAGLLITGICCNHLKHASQWQKKGLNLLEKEILKQIYPDGGGVEQAFSYLRLIVEFFLLAFILSKKNGIDVSPTSMNRLEKAFEFIMFTLKPDGNAPNFGDSDDARAIFLTKGDYWNCKGLLALGAALFKRSDFKWVAGPASEELLWLTGTQGFETYQNLKATKPSESSCIFIESGYAVVRDSWQPDSSYLILDCGPLGYRTGSHGHADAMSIQLQIFGEEALIDPGTFAYNQEPLFRNYFRSTKAHNTVSVDGQDQSQITDRMGWANIPRSVINDQYFSERFALIAAEHYGYNRLTSPVTHKRTILCYKNPLYYLIIDKLTASQAHTFDLHFHFPAKTRIEKHDIVAAMLPSGYKLMLTVKCSHPLSDKLQVKDPEPMGWCSSRYGNKTGTHALTFTSQANQNVYFYTLLMPAQDSASDIKFICNKIDDQYQKLIVKQKKITDIWLINRTASEIKDDNILLSGQLVVMRQDLNGSLISAYGIGMKQFYVDGQCHLDVSHIQNGFIPGLTEGDCCI